MVVGMARYVVLVRWYGSEKDFFEAAPVENIKEAMDFVRYITRNEKGQAILLDKESIPQVIELLRR